MIRLKISASDLRSTNCIQRPPLYRRQIGVNPRSSSHVLGLIALVLATHLSVISRFWMLVDRTRPGRQISVDALLIVVRPGLDTKTIEEAFQKKVVVTEEKVNLVPSPPVEGSNKNSRARTILTLVIVFKFLSLCAHRHVCGCP